MVKKIKLLSFVAILSLLLLAILNGSFSVAISMQGNVATFELEKDDPVAFGAMIPDTNMYTAVSIYGSNQGTFVQMDWLGNPLGTEIVNIPGNDISFVYPWFFDEASSKIYTPTNNNYTDPWDVRWLNISAFDALNETLSPFNISTVWNHYSMDESGTLDIFLNSSIPMQIDINIGTTGPKILRYDWLTNAVAGPAINAINLVSPSGKNVDLPFPRSASHSMITTDIFDYLQFVARETGIYRLLLDVSYNVPTIMHLEFLNLDIESLNTGEIKGGGNSDDIPTYQDEFDMEWGSNWYSFSGEKGDKFRLDIGLDYRDLVPYIDIWIPSALGYILQPGGWGSNFIYFPIDGVAYVSITDGNYYNLYRYNLYLTEVSPIQWALNNTLKTVRISKDEIKALDFTIEEDSFVRINSTSFGDGNPMWSGLLFKDAKKMLGYEGLLPIETKSADNMDFYYFYLPNGTYELPIMNSDPEFDSVIQFSIEFVEFNNATIPINLLSYPNHNPSTFSMIEFTPDEYYTSLKEAQWFEIDIAEPGQYRLNTSIWASDNLGVLPGSVWPSAVIVYNTSEGTYHDWTAECLDPSLSFPAFSDDGTTDEDYLYIAYPEKWGDIHYNFSQVGDGGEIYLYTWDGGWNFLDHTDNTRTGGDDFAQNGSQDIFVFDDDFATWIRGCDFDIPDVDEDLYYWMRVRCWDDFNLQLPYIELLTLSNITINGDVNFYLIRDSGYEYCDFWAPTGQPDTIDAEDDNFVININPANNFASEETWILDQNMNHHLNGIEPGAYKLLIIPAYWSHHGPVKIQFALENYMPYAVKDSYNITTNPTYHPWNITEGILDPEKPWQTTNYSLLTYGKIIQFNNTLVDINPGGSDGSKLVVECDGNALNWTQLIVCIQNVSDTTGYDLYLMQDLLWIDNSGPNKEIRSIATGVVTNRTFEFGVLADTFTLVFVFNEEPGQETITFKLGLSQYDTTKLYTEAPVVEAGVPIDPVMLVVIIIIISSIAGAAVVIVIILKKKGRI